MAPNITDIMSGKYKTLVTGANGFVGSALCCRLQEKKWPVKALMRSSRGISNNNIFFDAASIGDIGNESELKGILKGIHTVIHLAARVHVMKETVSDSLREFRKVNVEVTTELANASAKEGIKRFIYLSTIKVNGDKTFDKPFSADDQADPTDPYAISKWEAEQRLHEIGRNTGMEIVVVRPPLVYGRGVKGNFLRLLEMVNKGAVFPLANVKNKRSMISIDNLVDFLMCCMAHPAAVNETFFVSDDDDLSTPQLIGLLAKHLDKSVRLMPFPLWALKGCATLLGKKNIVERLCGSLQIDITKAKKLLDWQPSVSVDEGLMKTVEWYREKS
ncbi:MAG: SDR family oxidoreductase [Desulfobulbaceae bacterium]|nr:SDR family oxidoreductase [Desulfobulbaceae bacterium]